MPMTTNVTRCDDFLMFSVNKFLTKIAQICDYILGYFENITFQIKTSATNFGNQLWEICPTIIPHLITLKRQRQQD